jgi:hypothetical protein
MPEISLPDIKLPDVRFRDGKLRDLKLPDIDLRDRLPDVDLSKISLPSALRDISMPEVSVRDVHLPEVHMPDVRLRDMRMPEVHLPEFNLRDIRAPKVDLPSVDLRSLDPRRVDLSGIDARRLRQIAPFMKPAPRPASPLPWVIVAGIGGLFAGWWLATSSITGPAVRQFAAGVRARIDEWRSPRADWDDVEEQTEGFWSSEQGWKQEGSHRSAGRSEGTWSEGDAPRDKAGWDASATTSAADGTESAEVVGGTFEPTADAGVGGTAYEPASGEGSAGQDREG